MHLNAFLRAALLVLAVIGQTHAQTSDASIRKAVDDFLRIQIKGLPGKASYTIDTIQSGSLPPCSAFDVSTTAGAQAMGRSSVTVRCLAGANWSLLVPVKIHVLGNYLVSSRPITPGQTIGPGDIATQTGDLGELPGGILGAPEQAIGQVARSGLPAGRPLRADMLKAQTVIQQGQSVKVVSNGPGFQVANEGKAMSAAVIGQVIQVRLASGQVVSGVASASGNVEINF
jgi:flagella basal body P-ring formation protein FlgA